MHNSITVKALLGAGMVNAIRHSSSYIDFELETVDVDINETEAIQLTPVAPVYYDMLQMQASSEHCFPSLELMYDSVSDAEDSIPSGAYEDSDFEGEAALIPDYLNSDQEEQMQNDY